MVRVIYSQPKLPQANRVHRVGKFIDPFPLGFGTLPEKMVYAKLSRSGIAFYYLNDLTFSDPAADFFKIFQADFFIPSINLIIEIQGAHWHTMPKTMEADAYKFAVYEVFGYRAIAWWDYDILSHLDQLFMDDPQLAGLTDFSKASNTTELRPIRRTKTDSSKGIRTLNRRHKKPRTFHSIGVKGSRKTKPQYSWSLKSGR